MTLKVFVSYAKEDQSVALDYYQRLKHKGFEPWIDKLHILPGQNWEAEIDKAFKEANVILLLMSQRSVDKRGFVQREANDAIENLRYKKPTDIYAIPLLLDKCEVPQPISQRLQYIDMSDSHAWEQVLTSLRTAAEQQSIETTNGITAGPFQVFDELFNEQWPGQPGHDIKIKYPQFRSPKLNTAANELSLYFSGRAVRNLIASRQKPGDQQPELFPIPGEPMATDGRWENYGIVHASETFLSLTYDVSWYGAGAAHPNTHFETYNFTLIDRITTVELEDFFTDLKAASSALSEIVVKQLCREYWSRNNEKPDTKQIEWFNSGAGPDIENFRRFTIDRQGFQFVFAPYEVSSYADGRWSVSVPYYDLIDLLKPDGPHTLAIGRD
ncbi:TIR domain-containing protein [Pseudomonas sp. UFMG81]|uniref:TIR domain-containing protein n=1 Tax=Pseudomonas sp. UFMG81 TaxID=2745936 RepID=UPI00188E4C47|nr:TIR domain-containing protein [Pseudomonas sp. UFMG81]